MKFSALSGVLVTSDQAKVIGYLKKEQNTVRLKGLTLIDGEMPDHEDLLGSCFANEAAARNALVVRMAAAARHRA
jgi:hypothetical protein